MGPCTDDGGNSACCAPENGELLTQHNCAAIVQTDNVERVLADIDANDRNRGICLLGHAVLLVLAPLASLSLAGQEHGRTIPLTDMPASRKIICACIGTGKAEARFDRKTRVSARHERA